MKRLFIFFLLLWITSAVAENQPQTNPSQSIYQNMKEVPSIALITASLKRYHEELYNKLNDPNGEQVTVFIPSDRSVVSASKVLNAQLQRSGYPSLDELKKQMEEKGNTCPEGLTGEQCEPWKMNIGITDDQARAQAETWEKLPPGLNVTELGMKFGDANIHYLVIRGAHTTESFPAHCFYQTLLDSKFPDFVSLNDGAQVMHIEDIVKSGHQNANPATVPSDPLAERITATKILYGAAYDPIPEDTIDRLQSNASFTPGLVDNYIATVVIPDIQSANGILHVIDKLAFLPLNATTVMQTANLTRFQQLVKKAGLEDRLNQEPNITIFAPTDKALDNFLKDKNVQLSLDEAYFYPETDKDSVSFAAADQDNTNLQKLVLNHAVRGTYYPPFVPSEAQLQTLDGKTLQLRTVNPMQISIEGINTKRNDILLRNGVMHVIDGVLPVEFQQGTSGGGAPSGGACTPSGEPVIRPVPGAQISNETIAPSMLPSPGTKPKPTAKDLGCPESDGVCQVIDFDFLQCKTQFHTLSETERNKCSAFPENITQDFSFPNRTVCYNRSTHTCVHDYFLCPLSHPQVCGVQCYNSNEYKCYSTMSLCPVSAPEKCGDACYNKNNYSCNNGQLTSVSQSQNEQGKQGFDADGWKLNEDVPVHSLH